MNQYFLIYVKMVFGLLWDIVSITSILSSVSHFGAHLALKINYMFSFNNISTTRPILKLKMFAKTSYFAPGAGFLGSLVDPRTVFFIYVEFYVFVVFGLFWDTVPVARILLRRPILGTRFPEIHCMHSYHWICTIIIYHPVIHR